MNFENNNKNMKLWFFPFNLPLRPITKQEDKWASELSIRRNYEYRYSRGYARFALSTVLKKDPISIPLFSQPGKPPSLLNGLGFISISHCRDALLIGWSKSKIGVDIEPINRSLNTKKLSNYLFSKDEKSYLKNGNEIDISSKFLSIWVLKEALVKYSEGNILKDFKSWNINLTFNRAKNLVNTDSASINLIRYDSWIIGVASEINFPIVQEIDHIYK